MLEVVVPPPPIKNLQISENSMKINLAVSAIDTPHSNVRGPDIFKLFYEFVLR